MVRMMYTVFADCVGSSYGFKLNLLSSIKCWAVRSHIHTSNSGTQSEEGGLEFEVSARPCLKLFCTWWTCAALAQDLYLVPSTRLPVTSMLRDALPHTPTYTQTDYSHKLILFRNFHQVQITVIIAKLATVKFMRTNEVGYWYCWFDNMIRYFSTA